MGSIDSLEYDKFLFQILHLQFLVIKIKISCLKPLALNNNFSNIYLIFLQTTCLTISYYNFILIKIKIDFFLICQHVMKQNSIYFILMHTWIYFKALLNNTKNVLLKTYLIISHVSYTSMEMTFTILSNNLMRIMVCKYGSCLQQVLKSI